MNLLPANPIKLTDEELAQIEQLSATNYTPDKIALYLGVDKHAFMREYFKSDSLIRHHFDKGILEKEFKISRKLLENAESGNISAADVYDKRAERVKNENLINRIFNGG